MDMRSKFRLGLFAAYILVIAGFGYCKIVPGGQVEYEWDFSRENSFLSPLSPQERVEDGEKKFPNLIAGNPVYFNLNASRPFDEARLEIRYKNSNKLPLIEAGVLVDKDVWRYDLKPVQNIILDQLSLVWEHKYENGVLFLQNTQDPDTPIYGQISEMLGALKDFSQLAVYNYMPQYVFSLPDYSSSSKKQVLERPLAGNYEILTYIDSEDLVFDFEFENGESDTEKENKVAVMLYYDGMLLDSTWHIFKDKSEIKNLSISQQNLIRGAYTLEIKASGKLLTKSLSSLQKKLVFKNRLELAPDPEVGPLALFTDGNSLQAQTVYPDSIQSLKVGRLDFSLSETYKLFNWQIYDAGTSTLKRITVDKAGLMLSGDGLFAFSQEAYFNPRLKKVDKYLKENLGDVKYILAGYESPRFDDYSYVKELNFNLRQAYQEDNVYSFIISVPDLLLGEGGARIEIESIKISLSGKSLKQKIKEIIAR